MSVIETGRRVIGVLKQTFGPAQYSYSDIANIFFEDAKKDWYGSTFQNDANPHPYTLRPYEVQFSPYRLYIAELSAAQVQEIVIGELYNTFKTLLPPSEEAYSYQIFTPRTAFLANILYYLSSRERKIDEYKGTTDIVRAVTGNVGRFGVGLLEDSSEIRVVLFPPGYDHSHGYTRRGIITADTYFTEKLHRDDHTTPLNPQGEFPKAIGDISPIHVGDIGRNLSSDPNPQRRFKPIEIEGRSHSLWEAIAA